MDKIPIYTVYRQQVIETENGILRSNTPFLNFFKEENANDCAAKWNALYKSMPETAGDFMLYGLASVKKQNIYDCKVDIEIKNTKKMTTIYITQQPDLPENIV